MRAATESGQHPALEDDVAMSAPTVLIRAAAGVLAVAGLLTGLTGLQTVMSVVVFGAFGFVPPTQIALGIATIAVAFYLGRARDWAALAALGAAGALLALNVAWLIFSFANLLFSLFALLSAFAPLGAGILVLLAAADVRRASQARRRLSRSGLDLGI